MKIYYTFLSRSKRFSFRPLFLDVAIFCVSAIPLTQETTKLCAAKLQAQQENDDLYMPTHLPIVFFILELFQKYFYIFIGLFYVSGLDKSYRWKFIT